MKETIEYYKSLVKIMNISEFRPGRLCIVVTYETFEVLKLISEIPYPVRIITCTKVSRS